MAKATSKTLEIDCVLEGAVIQESNIETYLEKMRKTIPDKKVESISIQIYSTELKFDLLKTKKINSMKYDKILKEIHTKKPTKTIIIAFEGNKTVPVFIIGMRFESEDDFEKALGIIKKPPTPAYDSVSETATSTKASTSKENQTKESTSQSQSKKAIKELKQTEETGPGAEKAASKPKTALKSKKKLQQVDDKIKTETKSITKPNLTPKHKPKIIKIEKAIKEEFKEVAEEQEKRAIEDDVQKDEEHNDETGKEVGDEEQEQEEIEEEYSQKPKELAFKAQSGRVSMSNPNPGSAAKSQEDIYNDREFEKQKAWDAAVINSKKSLAPFRATVSPIPLPQSSKSEVLKMKKKAL